MDRRPLSLLAIWTLTVLAHGRGHAYGLCRRIQQASLVWLNPSRNSMGRVLSQLERLGFVERVGDEPGERSRRDRKLYEITRSGWAALKYERYRAACMNEAIDRAVVLKNAVDLQGVKGGY